MVYDSQNYWGSGLCPSSGMINTDNSGFFGGGGDASVGYTFSVRFP
jgi:hypothetical protein